jgi:protein-disulfide isomerase
MGARFPRVTIIEFVDYACGACKNFAPYLDSTLSKHRGEIAVVVKHLPLHGKASGAAARAAVCASRQSKLEPYHHTLMSQTLLLPDSFVLYASRVGVADSAGFRICMNSKATALVVAADSSDADRLGIDGVPTSLINGELYVGGQPRIEAIVARHLKER